MTVMLTPTELHGRLADRHGELALLDVREQGVFAKEHILYAVNSPLSRLELDVPRLVPRRKTPIVLCDDDGELASRAAEVLTRNGYGNVGILAGGLAAWRAAGLMSFSGVNVPSKAFGEFIEQTYDTPRVSAKELQALRNDGTDLVILDSRPFPEYHRMNIPDSINVPGAELVHRVHDLAPGPNTLVVVNCAGRTRSIIGAQSLRNAGLPNKVVALENGTMGWELAGFQCEHGESRTPPRLSNRGRVWAREAALRVADRFGVPFIDSATLAKWRTEADERTLFLCDVRSPEEFESGHITGARNTPGGQLVQATDEYIGVFGGRIVLVDDDGTRATMTASWLIQMGWPDVYVLKNGIEGVALETGPEEVEVIGLGAVNPAFEIAAPALAGLLPGRDVEIIDLADSRTFRQGHLPGTWFSVRSRLATCLEQVPTSSLVVVTSPDGVLAQLAQGEISSLTRATTKVLQGGTRAWANAGFPLEFGMERMTTTNDDIYPKPYDHELEDVPQAMRDYIEWEVNLVPQVVSDGVARFQAFPD